MKTMKNIIKTTFIFLLMAGILSCSNLLSESKSESSHSESSGSKTSLRINVEDTSVSRAVYPSTDASYLTNFVIKGKKTGSDATPAQLGTAADYTALGKLVITFEDGDEGNWDISLEAGYKIGSGASEQTLIFSDTKTVNIQKNIMNTVSFALKNSDYNYGGLNLTINFDDTTNTIDAIFLSLRDSSNTLIEDGTEITTFESITGGKSFTYSRSISDTEKRLESGLYHFMLQFSSDSDLVTSYSVNTYEAYINIVNGLTTTATLNIAVNQIYDVSYEYYEDGKKLPVENGQTFPTGVTINGTGVLPVKYFSAGTPLPALTLDGYVFAGWYDAAIGGNKYSAAAGFPASGTSKTFYARFIKPELVVSSNAFDGYPSIDAAIYYIASLGDSSSNWTINVNASVTGPQTIDGFLLDGKANSITIQGYTPAAGEPTDTIDAGLTTATKNGAALAINTTVPVTLKDIKITGGNNDNTGDIKGGGLFIGIGADVTLDDGVLINGNTADLGSGVYARSTFKMKGSAQVDSNNDVYLGMGADLNDMAYLEIAGYLTNSTPATITPYEYKNQRYLMWVSDSSLDTDEKAAECLKFAIKQPEGLNYTWNVNTKGYLTKYDYSTDAHDYVDFDLPSGTLWSAMNWGESDTVPGKQSSYWHNFTYGQNNQNLAWGDEWSIASTEQWQELIDNCYWKGPSYVQLGSGNPTYVYYVFKAKDTEDKGAVGTKDIYDQDKDVCIKITQSAYNKAVVYWPQTFVEASNENIGAANYTPKPTKIDMSGTAPVLTNTWTSASEQYQYYRLVISKKKTLVVTESGGSDTNSGRNAKDALASIQGALDKISATESSFEDPSAIDWEILYYGELTTGQQFATYNSLTLNSLTVYSITGTGSEATKSIWVFDGEGNLAKASNGGNGGSSNNNDFVTVAGGTFSTDGHVGTVENDNDYNAGTLTIPNLEVCSHLVTQYEYEQLMTYYGVAQSNSALIPTETSEEDKKNTPAYFVTWLDAIVYCNLLSESEGLTPVYSLSGNNEITEADSPWTDWGHIAVDGNGKYYYNQTNLGSHNDISTYDLDADAFRYDLSANGYRLPTTAEYKNIKTKNPDLLSGEYDEWCQNYNSDYKRCMYDASEKTPVSDIYADTRENNLGFRVVRNDFVLTGSFTFAGGETLCEGDEDRESKVFIEGNELSIGSLWVCNHEVTQGEYEQYCCYTGAKPSEANYGNGPDYPVYYVSWYDAIVYCNLRSKAEGLTPCYSLNGINDAKTWTGIKTVTEGEKTKYSCSYTESISAWDGITCDWSADGYRLPTSAEWEYVARGANLNSTEQTIYSGTDGTNGDLDNYAWHAGNSGGKTHTVKGKLPNALNLYDMTGNVSEICWDWHPADNTLRSVRSSGFSETHKLNAIGSVLPFGRYNYIGFRVVRKAPENP